MKTTNKREPEAHEEGANDEHGTTTPSVNIDDSGNSEGDIKDVLYRVGNEIRTATSKAGTLEDVDNVVHHDL